MFEINLFFPFFDRFCATDCRYYRWGICPL